MRDAPLTLGRTKWGVGASLRSAGQKRGCSAGQMEWEGIVTPNIVKGPTWGFLRFAQDEKRGRMRHKPSGSLSRSVGEPAFYQSQASPG